MEERRQQLAAALVVGFGSEIEQRINMAGDFRDRGGDISLAHLAGLRFRDLRRELRERISAVIILQPPSATSLAPLPALLGVGIVGSARQPQDAVDIAGRWIGP